MIFFPPVSLCVSSVHLCVPKTISKTMETPTEKNYQQSEEIEGTPRLVSEETENVDASGADDESTGMEGDDFLGRTNRENKGEEER